MPICPRCGKKLSSEQAVTYHLNKKYKCGSWKCSLCSNVFSTKFDLNIHMMSNCTECSNLENTSTTSNNILVTEKDQNDNIQKISSNCIDLLGFSDIELVGTILPFSKSFFGSIIYKHKNGKNVHFQRCFNNGTLSVDVLAESK